MTVNASEFKYVFSKRRVPTGTVIFTVVNKGKISHDFKILGKKTRSLGPGKSQKLTVKFTKKGQYAFLCTLFGHAKAGMKGKLRSQRLPWFFRSRRRRRSSRRPAAATADRHPR